MNTFAFKSVCLSKVFCLGSFRIAICSCDDVKENFITDIETAETRDLATVMSSELVRTREPE